jgi:hypothetical protein
MRHHEEGIDMFRRMRTVVAAPLFALALTVTGAVSGSASADDREFGITGGHYDGICDTHEICLYFNSDFQGSVADFGSGVPDFAGKVFKGPGAGRGQAVKNNAASVCNSHPIYAAVVYFNSHYSGKADVIPPNDCENLRNTYNENASATWVRL